MKRFDDRAEFVFFEAFAYMTMKLVVRRKIHSASTTLVCFESVLSDYLDFDVIFVLVQKVAVLLIRVMFSSIRLVRILIFLIVVVDEKF